MSRVPAVHMTELDVYAVAGTILRKRLGRFNVGDVHVHEEEDFDGAYVLRVVVGVEKRVPADDLVGALVEIQHGLRERGDERWVYLSTEREDGDDTDQIAN